MLRTLSRFILFHFLQIFLVSLLFFVLIIELGDLFSNLNRYLTLEVPFSRIMEVQLLFLPKSLQLSLPIALLFSVSFSLGIIYSNNELIAVFAAGIPHIRFVLPLIVLGGLLSVGSFYFEEGVVIQTLEQKNELSAVLLRRSTSLNSANVTRLSDAGRVVYQAAYYNHSEKSLSEVSVLVRDDRGNPVQRIISSLAHWDDSQGAWVFENAWIYNVNIHGELEGDSIFHTQFSSELLTKPPEDFQRLRDSIEDMTISEAREWISVLESSGLPPRKELTQYYERYAFALTPLIVMVISSAIGGNFKKNILLLSLLVSLGVSVVYYVIQMVGGLLAETGLIPPWVGAWIGVFLFLLIGITLLARAKT